MSSAGALTTAGVATAADGAVRELAGLEGRAQATSLCRPAVTCRCAPGDNALSRGERLAELIGLAGESRS